MDTRLVWRDVQNYNNRKAGQTLHLTEGVQLLLFLGKFYINKKKMVWLQTSFNHFLNKLEQYYILLVDLTAGNPWKRQLWANIINFENSWYMIIYLFISSPIFVDVVLILAKYTPVLVLLLPFLFFLYHSVYMVWGVCKPRVVNREHREDSWCPGCLEASFDFWLLQFIFAIYILQYNQGPFKGILSVRGKNTQLNQAIKLYNHANKKI